MPAPGLNDLQNAMSQLVIPFYALERDAVPPLTPRRFENDAEHSWSVAFLACSLAPEVDKNPDVGKIAQFAIVHDLVEVYAGDTSPWHEANVRNSKEEREAHALEQLTAKFAVFPWIAETIKTYETHESNEARFVWVVNKLIILLLRFADEGKYYVEHHVTKEIFDERLSAHKQKAHAHPAVGAYYDQMLKLFEAHPEFFAPAK